MKNVVGREIAEYYNGYGKAVPFQGAFQYFPEITRAAPKIKFAVPGKDNKVAKSLKDVFLSIPVKDGMTLSFHSAFREGDKVMNLVVQTAAELGLKDLKISSSAIFQANAPIVEHIRNGVVTRLDANAILGEVGECVMNGELPTIATIRSHGGRPRSIETGQQHIDVAFIGAPTADIYGNINGIEGTACCGSLGYAVPDSEFADYVVAVTDNLVEMPLSTISIPQTRVDYVVKVDCCGDPNGIATGTLRPSKDPIQLYIADETVKIVEQLGLIKDGYAFQCGSGGVSIAFAQKMGKLLEQKQIQAGFCVGGITGYMVDMLERGLVKNLYDVQCFDTRAINSIHRNPGHVEIGASFYANPFNSGCIVNRLDNCILGALEIDIGFNINVVTGNNGSLTAGIGGNPDCAAGASVTIAVANLLRGRIPVVVDSVHTICTPGETVDILVTERGVAVNPLRKDLLQKLEGSNIKLKTIEELKYEAEKIVGTPQKINTTGKTVAVVEYRDGTIIDTIEQVEAL